jgi:hypothetical protein
MTTPGSTDAPSLFFADARECRAWLGALAVSNAAQSMAALLDALRVFNRTEYDPLERLKCLELLRERIAFLFGELRTRHFAKPQPLAGGDASAWTTALAAFEEMEAGYRKCLSEGALGAHSALVSQRIVRCLGLQMLLHGLAYRSFDDALWSRLHQQYAVAEKAGQAQEKVKDSLDSDGGSSVMEAYGRAVLTQAAGLNEMTPAQVVFMEALLRQWMRKVQVLDRAPAEASTSVCPVVVDLAAARGPAPAPAGALAPAQRVIDVEELARSMRRRVRALQAGEDVATLGLPPEVSAVDPLHVLQRLVRRWSEPAPRAAAAKAPASPAAGLVFGLADIHFFLSGGKAFEQPGKERELSRQEKEDIAVFGRVTERTQTMMAATQVGMVAAPSFTVDPWSVLDETVDSIRLKRGASSRKSVAVGRVLALRLGDSAPFMLAVVRSIAIDAEGFVITVGTFPGRPEPTAVRGGNPAWAQGLILPAIEKLNLPRTILVPTGTAHRGRPMHFWKEGDNTAKVHEILERGMDFDRVVLA